jgi:hypothetical protein
MVRLTDNEIFEKLQSTAGNCKIRLTYTQKLFYIRLLEYADKYGTSCPEGLKISLSVNEMSSCLSITKRMVIQSLRVFIDCGVLLRYRRNTFPANACVTILKHEFYEK